METVNSLKAAISAAAAVLTALWGWFGWLIVAWVLCMGIDYITGTAAAIRMGTWSSKLARDGLWHKGGCIASVVVAGMLDLVVGLLVDRISLPFNYTVLLSPLVVFWYTLTEMGSIVENAGKMGAPIPAWLTKAIAALKDHTDDQGGGI